MKVLNSLLFNKNQLITLNLLLSSRTDLKIPRPLSLNINQLIIFNIFNCKIIYFIHHVTHRNCPLYVLFRFFRRICDECVCHLSVVVVLTGNLEKTFRDAGSFCSDICFPFAHLSLLKHD